MVPTAEATITRHGFPLMKTFLSVFIREDPWLVLSINDSACPSCCASAFAACHRHRWLAPGSLNPAAANQTLNRRALPSSPSHALPDNARTGRSGVATAPVLHGGVRSAQRLPRGCTTRAAAPCLCVQSSTLHHRVLKLP